jgi:RNA recognition motif-containing protein
MCDKTVFIGNLPVFTSTEVLHSIFSTLGVITNIDIKSNKYGLVNFAFITYEYEDSVERALNIHGMLYRGRRLIVKRAIAGIKNDMRNYNLSLCIRFHIRFFTDNVSLSSSIDELFLFSFLSSYAMIEDVAIKTINLTENDTLKGFGFVTCKSMHDISLLEGQTFSFNGIHISLTASHNLMKERENYELAEFAIKNLSL